MSGLLRVVGKRLIRTVGKKAIDQGLRSPMVQNGIQTGKEVIGKKVKEELAKRFSK